MFFHGYSKRERTFRWALGKVYRWVASFCRFLLRRSTTSTKIEQAWYQNRSQMVPIWPGGEGVPPNQRKYEKVKKRKRNEPTL
jgi:hypothetical protein